MIHGLAAALLEMAVSRNMPPPPEVNPTEWNRIVAAFAKHEGRVVLVAQELGWPKARTNRVYTKGYPSLGYPPVKSILGMDGSVEAELEVRAERQKKSEPAVPETGSKPGGSPGPQEVRAEMMSSTEESRIKRMVQLERDREAARKDAVQSRTEEALLVSTNRRNAIALNAVTSQVLQGAMKLSAKINQALELEASSKGKLELPAMLSLVRQAAAIARFNSEAAVLAVKAERLVMGQPTEVPGEGEGEGGTLDEAVAWIETAGRAVRLAQQRRLLSAGKEKTGDANP